MPIHLVTPVWSRAFARTFCDVMLASLLSPQNLPALSKGERHCYRIYTTRADRELIEKSAAYRSLAGLLQVDFQIVDPGSDKHGLSSDCYRDGVRVASKAGAGAMLLPPDMIVADGSVASMARLLQAGKRAVMTLGVRAVKETIVPELLAKYARGDAICVPSRELVKLTLGHLHPISESHMFDGDSAEYHAACLYWKIGGQGLLVHTFHLHPMAVHAASINPDFRGTIDDDMLHKAGIAEDAIHVSTDSDELLVVELSSREYAIATPPRGGMDTLAISVSISTNASHRRKVGVPLRLRTTDVLDAQWDLAEKRAQQVIARILEATARFERLEAGGGTRLERLRHELRKLKTRAGFYLAAPPGVRRGSLPVIALKLAAAALIVAGSWLLQTLHVVQLNTEKRP